MGHSFPLFSAIFYEEKKAITFSETGGQPLLPVYVSAKKSY
jgi:hypothetical protein